MTAERADVEGIGPTDHVPKGLSTLGLYRQQLLNNPGRGPWIVADWKALRTNAGRATLIRKYQRPFTFLRDDERNRCARFLLSLFEEAVPPNSIAESEFYGFVDCLLQSRIRYDKHLRGGAQLLSDVEENVVGMKCQAVIFPGPLLPLRTGTFGLMPPDKEQQASWPQAKSFPRTTKLPA